MLTRAAPEALDLATGGVGGGDSTTSEDRDLRAAELVPVFDRVDFRVTRATVTIVEDDQSSETKKLNKINGDSSSMALTPY